MAYRTVVYRKWRY